MSKIQSQKIIITALENELAKDLVPDDWQIFYSKIGKINATICTLEIIKNYRPKIIVNFGTAGSLNPKLSGLVEISSVVERDFCAMPFAKRGVVPFDDQPDQFFSANHQQIKKCICGTGDNFVNQHDQWLLDNNIELVDMELFAIAKTANKFNIPWRSFKFVSDNADEKSPTNWQENVASGGKLFSDLIKKLKVN